MSDSTEDSLVVIVSGICHTIDLPTFRIRKVSELIAMIKLRFFSEMLLTFRISSKMSSSSNGNRLRLRPSAPTYAQRMSEGTYAAGQQYWRDSVSEYPYFYMDSIPVIRTPLPYVLSDRGPPKSANIYPLQLRKREDSVRLRSSSSSTLLQKSYVQYRPTPMNRPYSQDTSNEYTEYVSLETNKEYLSLVDERKWEYTTLGTIISSKFENATVGDGTRLMVMSYNILAPSLLENHRYLYKECGEDVLAVKSRIAKFFSEVDKFNPDVLCLQEMESEYYYHTYLPEFKNRGYNGVYMKRTRDKVDGCAIMFKNNTLSLVEKLGVKFYQPHVEILDRDNIGLLVKLQSKRGKKLKIVVCTTHLLYNPKRQDVRMAQVQMLLAEMDRFSFCGFDEFNDHKYHPTILSGDFNMEPFSSGVRLLTEGRVSTLHAGYFTHINKKIKFGSLPAHFGINDQCQHYKIVLERYKKMKSLRTKKFEFDLKNHDGLVNIDKDSAGKIRKKFKAGSVEKSAETDTFKDTNETPEIVEIYPPVAENSTQSLLIDEEITIMFERTDNKSGASTKLVMKESQVENWANDVEQDVDINIVNQINNEGAPCTFSTGELSHRFLFKNAYGSRLDRKDTCENMATTKQIGWVCVDYVFYSSVWSHRYQKTVEGNLKLIRRYGLLNRQQCKAMGCMPNNNVSSDHFPLITEFLLKG